MNLTALEKKGSRHNLQHAGRSIYGSVPSFSPKPTNEAISLSQDSVNDELLGLLGPCHQHEIGTFNTCLRGPTHQSLINTGGGYSLEGAGFPHTTPRPSQSMIFPFHLRALPGLQFNHRAPTNQSWVLRNLWPPRGLPTTRPSTMAYIMPSHS
jgi:hypothetical protein